MILTLILILCKGGLFYIDQPRTIKEWIQYTNLVIAHGKFLIEYLFIESFEFLHNFVYFYVSLFQFRKFIPYFKFHISC